MTKTESGKNTNIGNRDTFFYSDSIVESDEISVGLTNVYRTLLENLINRKCSYACRDKWNNLNLRQQESIARMLKMYNIECENDLLKFIETRHLLND